MFYLNKKEYWIVDENQETEAIFIAIIELVTIFLMKEINCDISSKIH